MNSISSNIRQVTTGRGSVSQSLQQPGFLDPVSNPVFDDHIANPYPENGSYETNSSNPDLISQNLGFDGLPVHKNSSVALDATSPACTPPAPIPASSGASEVAVRPGGCTPIEVRSYLRWIPIEYEAQKIAFDLFHKSKSAIGSKRRAALNRLSSISRDEYERSVRYARDFGDLLFIGGLK